MTFSYTDDAIVSTSPTGRHLSTVIKRPCVLMSGWNEHAEEICKVLNDRAPAHSLADLIDRGYLTDYKSTRKGTTVALDFADLEKRACEAFGAPYQAREWTLEAAQPPKGRRGQLIAVLTAQLASIEAELARAHEQLRKPVELNGERLAALASMKPGAFLYTVGGAARAIKRV